VISLHDLMNWAEIQGALFLCSPLHFGDESHFYKICYIGYMLEVAGIICFGLVGLIFFKRILIRKVSKNPSPPKIHGSEHCNKHNSLRPVNLFETLHSMWNLSCIKKDLYIFPTNQLHEGEFFLRSWQFIQLVNKFLIFYGTGRFIRVLTPPSLPIGPYPETNSVHTFRPYSF
jgi:hypothetical protein